MEAPNKHLGQSISMVLLLVLASVGIVGVMSMMG
jgi:hypothetical protein